MTPPIDIIISLHSTSQYPAIDYFEACVDSIRRHTNSIRFIFVNDASCEEHYQRMLGIISRFPEHLFIKTTKQLWFTRAHNLGLRMVRTPWCVMINADCVVDVGWLDELFAIKDELESQGKKVGLVGSQQSGEEPRRYHCTQHPGYVTGHCYLLSMQALYEVSAARGMPGWYFDETAQRTIHIFSDNEICEKMNALGYETAVSFKAAIGHHGGKSWGHNLGRVFGLTLDEVNPRWT